MAKKKNKDNDIIVSFLGTSRDNVTGSCIVISYMKNDKTRGTVVLECGLSQDGRTVKEQYLINKNMIENIGKDVVNSTSYLILGHCHLDHVGNSVIFNGNTNEFKGKILGSYKTLELTKDILKDSVYIHKRDIEYLKGKGEKVKPLYSEQDMYDMFNHMEVVEVGEEIKLDDNLTIVLNNNSHVVGSCNIKLIFRKPNNSIKTIIYTSDMGSLLNKDYTPYLDYQYIPNKCNLFISEATYNRKEKQFNKQDVINERNEMKQYIKECLCNGKRVILPTFSFGRSQTLATMFKEWYENEEWFDDIPVVMDGVLMNNINSTYKRILEDENKDKFLDLMNWKNLKCIKNYDSTVALLSQKIVGIYIVSSGFMNQGRWCTYAPSFLGSEKASVIITGYCGTKDSIGGQILDDTYKTVTIDGHTILKRAEIKQYKTFSSHISHDELLELWKNIKCDKILVHHSGENKEEFIQEAKEYLRDNNVTTSIVGVGKCCYQFIL